VAVELDFPGVELGLIGYSIDARTLDGMPALDHPFHRPTSAVDD